VFDKMKAGWATNALSAKQAKAAADLAARQAKARKWELPKSEHLKILREIGKKKNRVEVYEFWLNIAKILPETDGVACQIDFRGAIPYVKEIVE